MLVCMLYSGGLVVDFSLAARRVNVPFLAITIWGTCVYLQLDKNRRKPRVKSVTQSQYGGHTNFFKEKTKFLPPPNAFSEGGKVGGVEDRGER